MRSFSCVMGVMGMVLFIGHGTGSVAYGKTVEAGESSSSWNGTGEFLSAHGQISTGDRTPMTISLAQPADKKFLMQHLQLLIQGVGGTSC